MRIFVTEPNKTLKKRIIWSLIHGEQIFVEYWSTENGQRKYYCNFIAIAIPLPNLSFGASLGLWGWWDRTLTWA